ncbi:sensor histidine kinase [Amycolatopsis taiwanensis]|uniref:sensor histidine kinase n=1 Tax=Amycolatopsis taiwanensis TaxID=342230 RepID=UPI0007C5C519|nr:histidine kinase [Amycolatopsis taiwanensis]
MRIRKESLRAPVVGYGWVRLLPLVGVVATLALQHLPQLEPSGWDWTLGLASATLILAGGVAPLAVTLAQCGLVVAAAALATAGGAAAVQILASVALGELAFRRSGWRVWCGAAALTVASGVNYYPGYAFVANVLKVVLDVGLPLLLGSFLRSQRKLAWQAEQRAADAENAARAAERAAVARELHDVVAHHVAAIVLRIGVVRHVVPSADPRVDAALDDVHGIAGQALTDLRRLVSVLRDPDSVDDPGLLAPEDLVTALDDVLARTRRAGVAVRAEIARQAVERLDVTHRHAVLRLVQEGLTNVLKHAGRGTCAWVEVSWDEAGQRVRVAVRDDGGGTSDAHPLGPGHGLAVMRERIELLHGSLRAGPSGGGWALDAILPEPRPVTEVCS